MDLARFDLDAPENAELREPVTRLAAGGARMELHPPPLGLGLVEELRAVSDDWLDLRHAREKSFASGWFDDAYVAASRVAAVHAPEVAGPGAVTGFVN